ncbi:MAG: dipeptidyl aminopeptidase/acylaminoacyl peptidase [Maribacter sp.]|jgi:dipeptidyl aminopeptidase/acylaminoacyl peptidase
MRLLHLFAVLLLGITLSAQSTIKEILDAPFASDLIVTNDGKTIAWVDNTAGERNIFIANGKDFSSVYQFTNYVGDEGIAIGNLQFTPNGNSLIFVRGNTKNRKDEPANPALLQQNTEQAIFIQPLEGGSSIRIALGSNPRLSHDGSTLAFIKGGQIFTASLSDSIPQPKQLFKTRGGQSDIKWSPDDSHISFTSSRGDHSYIGVYDITKEKLAFMDPSVDRDFSPEWSPDGEMIAFIRSPNANEVAPFAPRKTAHPWSIRLLEMASTKAREIWKADDDMGSAYFGQFPSAAIEWATNDQLIFPWEKKGWMHLYALQIQSGEVTELTSGEGIVEDYRLTRDRNALLFTTNVGDKHRRHIGKIDLESKKQVMLTSGEGVEFSPQETNTGIAFLKTSAQHMSRPAVLKNGNVQLIGKRSKVFNSHKIPELAEIKATDGKSFMATIFYPDNYDVTKKYPSVVFLHGGSRRQMLQAYHYSGYYSNAFALQQYFASQGYLAMMINYRSGIGYGVAFREADNYGITGASEVYDLIGAGEYLAARSDVDPKRIALWGGSYGGYLTAHGLARRSDLFAVGVDIHGVHNWNTELPTFAGWYDQNHFPEIAALAFQSSPEAYLDGWKSPVLLIHGDDDRNVPFAESVVLSEQLRNRDVYFEQLIFPDEVHGFLLHENWVRCQEATFEFINRHIGRPKK